MELSSHPTTHDSNFLTDSKVGIEAFKNTGRMVRDLPGGPQRPERAPVRIKEAGQLEAMIGPGKENSLEFHLSTAS